MEAEHFADVLYRMGINTYLFAILVDHINEDEVEITLRDFENKRMGFINCGIRQVDYAFTFQELREWLASHPKLVKVVGKDKWVCHMRAFIGDINKMSEAEKEFTYHNKELAKIFCLFCNLNIDMRIFDDYGCVAGLLHCNAFVRNTYPKPRTSRKLTPKNQKPVE